MTIMEIRVIHPNGTVYQQLIFADPAYADLGFHRSREGLFVSADTWIEPPWIWQVRYDGGEWRVVDQELSDPGDTIVSS